MQTNGRCVVVVEVVDGGGGQRGSLVPGLHTRGGCVVATVVVGQRGSFESGVQIKGRCVVVVGQRGSVDPGMQTNGGCVVVVVVVVVVATVDGGVDGGSGHSGLSDPGVQVGGG